MESLCKYIGSENQKFLTKMESTADSLQKVNARLKLLKQPLWPKVAIVGYIQNILQQ